jgi:hypothetical protein
LSALLSKAGFGLAERASQVSDDLQSSVWTRARERVVKEFEHAPVAFVAAIVAILDVIWRLIGGELGTTEVTTVAPSSSAHLGRLEIVPVLEFLFFQVVISFVWHRVNFWISLFSGGRASAEVIAGLLSTVLAAYLTCLNAFYLARFEIATEGRHYMIFESVWTMGFAVSIILIAVFSIEGYGRGSPIKEALFRLARTVLPMAIVFFCACLLFEIAFADTLHDIWAARPHLG